MVEITFLGDLTMCFEEMVFLKMLNRCFLLGAWKGLFISIFLDDWRGLKRPDSSLFLNEMVFQFFRETLCSTLFRNAGPSTSFLNRVSCSIFLKDLRLSFEIKESDLPSRNFFSRGFLPFALSDLCFLDSGLF
jgi:hypothetical protein